VPANRLEPAEWEILAPQRRRYPAASRAATLSVVEAKEQKGARVAAVRGGRGAEKVPLRLHAPIRQPRSMVPVGAACQRWPTRSRLSSGGGFETGRDAFAGSDALTRAAHGITEAWRFAGGPMEQLSRCRLEFPP
jgi:hypothetical protein